MRDPDAGGWANWEGLVPQHGREYVRRGFEESGEFATIMANIVPNGSRHRQRCFIDLRRAWIRVISPAMEC